ncbi:Uncharacterised protein [Salmonella enterica subsp. enterica serovar Enteritidis]|nr:Uncharacterised protein [Salmonella enterica subsp. enterica serovar Enteritidis]
MVTKSKNPLQKNFRKVVIPAPRQVIQTDFSYIKTE